MNIDISIIVPIYNCERYIAECVESVLAQTVKNFELVLVDDASTDKSYEIAKEYKNQNPEIISLYRFEKNGKQGRARNYGIENSKGKYVMFLDSDDVLDPNICELLSGEAKRQNADIVFCDYMKCLDGNEEYCVHVSKEYMGPLDVARRKALITTSVVPWAKIIRRKMIIDNDILFPENTFYEDQATTYLYYMYATTVCKVEKALYKYRISQQSTTTQRNVSRHFQALEMALLLIDRVKARNLYKDYYEEIEFFAIEQMYCRGIERIKEQFDDFPLEYAQKTLELLLKKFPGMQDNKYYKMFMSEKNVMMLQAHLSSAEELIRFLHDDKTKLCENYTYRLFMYDEKMEALRKWCVVNNCDLVLWGAGKYGKTIVNVFKEYGMNIKEVYDSNCDLVNTWYESIIVTDYRRDTEACLLVVIPFENWVHDVVRKLLMYKRNVKIINLEVYIKHNIGICIRELVED